jgi:hypothetical protein
MTFALEFRLVLCTQASRLCAVTAMPVGDYFFNASLSIPVAPLLHAAIEYTVDLTHLRQRSTLAQQL